MAKSLVRSWMRKFVFPSRIQFNHLRHVRLTCVFNKLMMMMMKAELMQSGRLVCILSVWVQPRSIIYAWMYMKFLSEVGLGSWPSLEVI